MTTSTQIHLVIEPYERFLPLYDIDLLENDEKENLLKNSGDAEISNPIQSISMFSKIWDKFASYIGYRNKFSYSKLLVDELRCSKNELRYSKYTNLYVLLNYSRQPISTCLLKKKFKEYGLDLTIVHGYIPRRTKFSQLRLRYTYLPLGLMITEHNDNDIIKSNSIKYIHPLVLKDNKYYVEDYHYRYKNTNTFKENNDFNYIIY